jgi:hypothetical protein
MVESTVIKLNQFKNSNGPELEKTYNGISDNGKYRNVKLTDREQSSIEFQNSASLYLNKLTENIESRFDEELMKSSQLLNTVLRPSYIPKNVTQTWKAIVKQISENFVTYMVLSLDLLTVLKITFR